MSDLKEIQIFRTLCNIYKMYSFRFIDLKKSEHGSIKVQILSPISVLESFKKRGACLDKKNEAMCIDLQEGIFCSNDFLHKIAFLWLTNISSF